MTLERAGMLHQKAKEKAILQAGKRRPRRSRGRRAATLLLLLLGSTSAWAQTPGSVSPLLNFETYEVPIPTSGIAASEPLRPPGNHAFWDRSNMMLHGANLVAQGLDYWSTRKLLKRDFREANPIVRPFAGNDGAMAAHKFGLSFGGTVAASYLLHKSGRHRWERLATMVVLGSTVPAVGLNFRFVF